jgi:UDP-N-acetylmuramoyl-L-alanyl-D-glutamate--2,6-diaminopimelate ligase
MDILKLYTLLEGLDFDILEGNCNVDIDSVQYDSRKVGENGLFVAIEGFNVDGHKYLRAAIERGAAAVLVQKDVEGIEGCTVIKVDDTRKALAVVASNYYEKPSSKLKLIGITGTNGKTTSSYMIKSILEAAGFKVGLIGTIANYIGDKKIEAHRTTPESLELHELFNDMVKSGVEYCVMEVSSHSLALNRVYGITFQCGIFTNLTRDHLDFHKTFEEYFNAKLLLFKSSNISIVNIDDEYGEKIESLVNSKIVKYSLEKTADVSAEKVNMHSRGIQFEIKYKDESEDINLMIPGKYNVYNALCAASACLTQGINFEAIRQGLENVTVPGRCEIVTKEFNLGFEIIVDYAHTPDGLDNILKTAREFTEGKLISVFGCGGDRDKTKRPIMGKIASDLSDIAIVTSDNPRSEKPMAIINDILAGINKDNYIVIENRREAIERAVQIAGKGDVIVVAGKGHEDYQEINGKTISFDERVIIKEIIEQLK